MKLLNTKAILLIIKNILQEEGECFWSTVIQEYLHAMQENTLTRKDCLILEETLWGCDGFFAYIFINNEERMTNREEYLNVLLNDLKHRLYVAWHEDTDPFFKVKK
jgi:hypothetical protein